MNANIKKNWVNALRSGVFTQVNGTLGYDGIDVKRRCCLGVLCEITENTVMEGSKVLSVGRALKNTFIYDMPSKEVLHMAGLHHKTAHKLAGMNDAGYSFNFIADYIEEKL